MSLYGGVMPKKEDKLKKIEEDIETTKKLKEVVETKKEALKNIKEMKDLILSDDMEELDNITEEDEEVVQNNEEVEDEVAEFIKKHPDIGAKVSVLRWNDELNNWGRIGEYSIKDFEDSIENIARKYGGGNYKFIIRNKEGQYVKQFTQVFDPIAYPVPKKDPDDKNIVVETKPETGFDPLNMIKLFQEMQEKQQTVSISMITSFMNTLATMIANQKKENDELEKLIKLKSLLGDVNPTKDISKIIEVLKTGIELGQVNNSSGGEDESLVEKLISKFLLGGGGSNMSNKILETLSKIQDNQTSISNQKVIVNDQKPDVNKQIPLIKKEAVNMSNNDVLVKFAKLGISPSSVAKTLISSLDDATFNLFYNLKENPEDIKKIIYDYNPSLKEYNEWVENVIKEGIKYMEEIVAEEDKKEDKK